jgi:hypothetical protein
MRLSKGFSAAIWLLSSAPVPRSRRVSGINGEGVGEGEGVGVGLAAIS